MPHSYSCHFNFCLFNISVLILSDNKNDAPPFEDVYNTNDDHNKTASDYFFSSSWDGFYKSIQII